MRPPDCGAEPRLSACAIMPGTTIRRTDYTPRRVVYESESGLGSGMEVLYSDYATINRAWYPKSMSIKFSAQQQHGLELHFSDVAFLDRLADKEFHR